MTTTAKKIKAAGDATKAPVDDICRHAAAVVRMDEDGALRYEFRDGSALITQVAAHDIVAPGCENFCLSRDGCACEPPDEPCSGVIDIAPEHR